MLTLQLPFPLIFGLAELINIFPPDSQVASHTLLQGLLVGTFSISGFLAMRHVIGIRYS